MKSIMGEEIRNVQRRPGNPGNLGAVLPSPFISDTQWVAKEYGVVNSIGSIQARFGAKHCCSTIRYGRSVCRFTF
jgi:hypothetical protein